MCIPLFIFTVLFYVSVLNRPFLLSPFTFKELLQMSNDERSREGCVLFVGNLPFRIAWQDLKDAFKPSGEVRFADLIADRNGNFKGSAMVTMGSPADAQSAIEMWNEKEFGGRRLIVRELVEGRRPPVVSNDRPQGGRGRGRGAGGAVGPAGPMARGGRGGAAGGRGGGGADVGVPKPRSQQGDDAGRRLFVSNLPYDCTSVALSQTFNQIGKVDRADVLRDDNNRSRGLGVVVMGTEALAKTAIAEFDGVEMAGRAMSVRFDRQ